MSEAPGFDYPGSLHRLAVLRRTYQVHRHALDKQVKDHISHRSNSRPGENTGSNSEDNTEDPEDFFETVEIALTADGLIVTDEPEQEAANPGEPRPPRATTPSKHSIPDDSTSHTSSSPGPSRTFINHTPTTFNIDPVIFEDPDTTMSDVTMSDTAKSSQDDIPIIDPTKMTIPEYIMFEDPDKLRFYETSIKTYLSNRDHVLKLQPIMDNLARWIVHPQRVLSAATGKALRPALSLIHDVQDDLLVMPTKPDLAVLLETIQTVLIGGSTIPSASKDKPDADTVDSPMSGMDEMESSPGPTDQRATTYEFIHHPTSPLPFEKLDNLYQVINHEYSLLIEGPIKKSAKLREVLTKISEHSSSKVGNELRHIRFGEKFEEWEAAFGHVWFRLGGGRY
ncbi:hypothetical protein BDZ85DRAFT_277845 [Elsinoe ampelina]|uniref:Uncharacterized protein n=1 Tax=Elsinoe ampelina TaxID=302913 RepID=A0A6A6GQG0_9PEZI|nr:hypothetical protein BDZ85DRAFT_277845 [Elsinoe ampelina]